MYVILALLPIVAILANILQIDYNEQMYIEMGYVQIYDSEIFVEENTWSSRLLVPLGLSGDFSNREGLTSLSIRFLEFMQNNVGITISMPIVLFVWYMIYLFIIELFTLIFDLLLFIPRKCREVFE